MFKSISTSLLWRGILAIAIGVVSVAWPHITVGAFVILFAVYAFMVAAADAVRAFGSRDAGPLVGYLLLSVLSVAAGVVALVWPNITAQALTICPPVGGCSACTAAPAGSAWAPVPGGHPPPPIAWWAPTREPRRQRPA